MGERKISDLPDPRICLSFEHEPASMVVREPGIYEHTCPECGHKTVFRVDGPTLGYVKPRDPRWFEP